MPKGDRHLQSSASLTLEFTESPETILSEPVPELMFHFAWDFLDTSSITSLCKAAPVMSSYGSLRSEASSLSIKEIDIIRRPLPHAKAVSSISPTRARDVAKLLLLCDFDTGNLIRCLGGNYTSEFLDFASIDACLLALTDIPTDTGEPPHDFNHLHHLFHQHVPFKGSFRCARKDMLARNLYNNHRASDPYLSSIHKKSAVDIQKSYSLALPRWILRFLNGIFLAALGFAVREHKGKIKGRQVNDPSALLTGPADSGALNSHIDRRDPVAMPPVHYQTALSRLWQRVYNLRIRHPNEDIMIYKDDLVSAFRRLRYHPDIAAAYSFVLGDFVVIPIGMVFGSRDAPSLFCLLSELRSFASRYANRLPITRPDESMIDQVEFESPPPPHGDLKPAFADSLNPGVDGSSLGPQPTFVDDTIMAEIRALIRLAAENSVLTASIFVGHSDLVEEPVSIEKFERFFSHLNETLGFMTDSRSMTVSYPDYKRASLLKLLQASDWSPKSKHKIRSLAQILGKVRHLAQVLPFGNHLSIHLQLCLSRFILHKIKGKNTFASMKQALRSAWNPHTVIHISHSAAADLRHLRSLLESSNEAIWHRPLSLLVPRDPHFDGQSDACNIAMGGLSFRLLFQWRLSNAAFRCLPAWKNQPLSTPAWHINIHEFIGIIINAFFMMFSFAHHHHLRHPLIPDQDGWIFLLEADNTSALSWMTYLSRSREPHTVNLCRLFSHLVFKFNSLFPSRFDGKHLPGKLNCEADGLSRPQDHPTYESLFNTYPEMRSLPAFRVPPSLISGINACLSNTLTKATLNDVTATLTSARLSSFRLGAPDWASKTLLSTPSRQSIAKGSSSPMPSKSRKATI